MSCWWHFCFLVEGEVGVRWLLMHNSLWRINGYTLANIGRLHIMQFGMIFTNLYADIACDVVACDALGMGVLYEMSC